MRTTKTVKRPLRRYERSFEEPAKPEEEEQLPEENVIIYADITSSPGIAPIKQQLPEEKTREEEGVSGIKPKSAKSGKKSDKD
jgi:hypothetical protein